MDQHQAVAFAGHLYGSCTATISGMGECVISVRNHENHFVPLGYGSNWDEPVMDCARNAAFADELCYA